MADVGTTDHFEIKENELLLRLKGRVSIEHGAAMYNFIKDGKVQDVIHALKYKNKPQAGVIIGRNMGLKYLESKLFSSADYLIPIPIHQKKRHTRGYNQCSMIAKGFHEQTQIPINENCLIKRDTAESQTKKIRSDRFVNVLDSFELSNEALLENKTILLIDDVLTTGATIEAAYTRLKAVNNITIQVLVAALAKD